MTVFEYFETKIETYFLFALNNLKTGNNLMAVFCAKAYKGFIKRQRKLTIAQAESAAYDYYDQIIEGKPAGTTYTVY